MIELTPPLPVELVGTSGPAQGTPTVPVQGLAIGLVDTVDGILWAVRITGSLPGTDALILVRGSELRFATPRDFTQK
jgi:hypothetical protein